MTLREFSSELEGHPTPRIPGVDAATGSLGQGLSVGAGLAIGALGMAAPYWINALSTFAVIAALIWWRPPQPVAQSLPAERVCQDNRIAQNRGRGVGWRDG